MVDSTANKEKEYAKPKKGECEEIQHLDLKNRKKPVRSVNFLCQQRTWEDEEFLIPADLLKGITQELGFSVPSMI